MRNFRIIISLASLTSLFALVTCDMANDFETPYENYFIKYYGGDGKQTGVDMVVNTDGTIVMVGNSEVGISKRIFFIRVDPKGNIITQKLLGGTNENVKDIEPTSDGGFVILSEFQKSATNVDFKLIKVSLNGDEINSIEYGSPEPFGDFPSSVTPLANGGFVVAGRTEDIVAKGDPNNTEADPGDIFLYKFSDQLLPIPNSNDNSWGEGTQGLAKQDGAVKYFEKLDGTGYCVAYTSENVAANNSTNSKVLFYFKVPDDGFPAPIANYSPPGSLNSFNTEIASAIELPFNEGYAITGRTITGVGSQELFFCKMANMWWPNNEPANAPRREVEIYTKISPEGSQGVAGISVGAVQVGPRGYLIAGNDLRQSGTTNIWLTKLDLLGEVKWSASFGSDSGNDAAGAVAELPDGRILVLGTMELEANLTRMVLIKLNASGKLLK
ncbi:MAG: hypothetical protein JNM57_02780 [Cyclobacteriaceae bacterium]|nr:hypothetical protein [Cyclobacteriaceae bacterium]